MAVRSIPWRTLMEGLRWVRNNFYKIDRPGAAGLLVPDLTVEELDTRLREDGCWEEAEEYTFKYDGEILNLRRPAGLMEGNQMAIHLRVFEHERGLEILCHYEASRFNHPRLHLDEYGFSRRKGRQMLMEDLEKLGIGYENLNT